MTLILAFYRQKKGKVRNNSKPNIINFIIFCKGYERVGRIVQSKTLSVGNSRSTTVGSNSAYEKQREHFWVDSINE